MDIQILKILSAFALMQVGIWLIFLFNVKKSDPRQRIFLVKTTFLFIVFVLGISLLIFGSNSTTYFLANITNLTIFLPLPLLYTYVHNNKNEKTDEIQQLYHYIPFAVILIGAILLLLFSSVHTEHFNLYSSALIILFCIQCLIYVLLFRKSTINLILFKKINENHTEQNNAWIKSFVIGFSTILLLNTAAFTSWNVFSNYELCIFLCSLFFICSFIAINIVMLIALLKKEQLLPQLKYSNSTISKTEINEQFIAIKKELIDNKLYKDPLISLALLSKKIQIPQSKISRILNEKSRKNFNELINEHRIKDAQELIINNPDSLKILDIAFEVGYNSKSTFNTAFKKFTGLTPSEFRAQNSKF